MKLGDHVLIPGVAVLTTDEAEARRLDGFLAEHDGLDLRTFRAAHTRSEGAVLPDGREPSLLD